MYLVYRSIRKIVAFFGSVDKALLFDLTVQRPEYSETTKSVHGYVPSGWK